MDKQSRVTSSKGKDKGKARAVGKPNRFQETSSRKANPQLVITEEGDRQKIARQSESANTSEENKEDTHARSEISHTRWMDVELLARMGILEEVRTILGRMGTVREPDMDYVYYLAMEEKRRLQNVPSPSPPASDNQSLHLTSSDQEDSN